MSKIEFDQLPELKPCPFCGNQFGAHEDHAFIETQGTKWGQVNCCNAEVRTGYGPLSDWIEGAIETWNTRPIEDALNLRINDLRSRLELTVKHFGGLGNERQLSDMVQALIDILREDEVDSRE